MTGNGGLSMSVWYNEIDTFAAHWLGALQRRGHLPVGEIERKGIEHVNARHIRAYTHCHFFAGIGGWALALHLAGWPIDRPVWTGSCPCQPFSPAGKRKGFKDKHHLWPVWFKLIRECRPQCIFGEQVASPDGMRWFDVVSSHLEANGYRVGLCVFPACGVGAPHLRQRLYWVADTGRLGDECRVRPGDTRGTSRAAEGETRERQRRGIAAGTGGASRGVADAEGGDREVLLCERRQDETVSEPIGRSGPVCVADAQGQRRDGLQDTAEPGRRRGTENGGDDCGMAHAGGEGLSRRAEPPTREERTPAERSCDVDRPGPTNGYRGNPDWLLCTDGKWRPVEPGTFPLADGIPGRVGRLRGYGNAIVIPQAVEFVRAYMDAEFEVTR